MHITRVRPRRLALALAFALLALVALAWTQNANAPAAQAHATTVSTDPQNGSQIDTAPTAVRVTFDEAVTFNGRDDAVVVIDHDGSRVDTGSPTLDDARTTLTIPVQSGLENGIYIASWSVISADTHPVGGSLQFGIGVPASALSADSAPTPSPWLTVAVGIAKGVVYLGLVLGFGFLPAVLLLGPDQRQRRVASHVAAIGLGILTVASVTQLALQFLWGLSAAPAASPGEVWTSFWAFTSTPYGVVIGLRLVIVLAAAALLFTRNEPSRVKTLILIVLGILAVASVVQNGHGGAGAWWQYTSALVHASGAVAWIGGLVALGWLLLRHQLTAERARRLPKWSLYAGISVGVIVLTGLVQAAVEVGYPGALLQTTYGFVLLIKVALVLIALGLAFWAFRWTKREPNLGEHGRPRPGQTARLRQRVQWEASIGIIVVVISGVLSSITPAKAEYRPVASVQTQAGPYELSVQVTPTRVGPATFAITAVRPGSDTNTPLAQELDVTLSQVDGSVQSLPVSFPYRIPGAVSPGTPTPVRFGSAAVNLPDNGEWAATITVVDSPVQQYTTTVSFTVE